MSDTSMPATVPVAGVDRLHLSRSLRDAILVHLLDAAPHEGVGLLAVTAPYWADDELYAADAIRWFPGTNVDASPAHFTMDPAEVLAALKEMRQSDIRLGAIVHSHLAGPATPSSTDVRESHYPEALSIIVSLLHQPATMRAWRIVREDDLAVVQPVEIAMYDDNETGSPHMTIDPAGERDTA